MQLKRINDAQDEQLRALISLYEESFPQEERRLPSQLVYLIAHKTEMYFNAIHHEGELCGLFVYWDFKDFYYLEHLAVFPSMRNKKIGAKLLEYISVHLPGIHLLEVEPPTDEMAIRRIGYYRRNGYEVLEKNYLQPSYTKSGDAFPLWIMGNRSSDSLSDFIHLIQQEVYIGNRSFG